ncbi:MULTISPECIES: ribose 5-phosphate isomerase A [Yersinia pseudotuberculosis complex]|uniref:ribose 5-phosphate isomerase A n=1 Tax=Yersinia pseudotuberculosis complex TaxID=1649845 RepID=UPI00005F67C1|nr:MULTISPECIES: ribose 5-phosphate isomerase A [Yersinia pseudotuberculosis complex]ABX86108.1 ribose 5-phosphate isomerase A [Yersinia pestis Angola]AJJ85480.1 ribose 5-phosphate isomerase A [Yersinia pestis Angola]QES97793.1 ribose 5-phosphate isomerase A [Yersinia pseudotuberculosis]CFU90602.1 ribose 5-phosphate isomerase [Yersinia pseudotuberculosis]CNB51311.1 ribose 5-phosphate isomerase [Yersinia pseudotuberculosis]
MSNQQNDAKRAAARRVIQDFVFDGMTLGLGSGTTSHFFVRELGQHVAKGLQLTCTTTSRATSEVARDVGIELSDPNEMNEIDLTIDGPDEIDRRFNMIKGGGACLLWEKIIAHASKRMICICDETKIVNCLGQFPLPVEIVPFAWKQTERRVERVLAEQGLHHVPIIRRMGGGHPVITDSGNFILDCHCGAIITAPEPLEIELNRIPGGVENGLFTREATGMVVGYFDGSSYVQLR